jgi:hypothetical protein
MRLPLGVILIWIIDEITPGGDSDLAWICLLWAVINHHSGIGDNTIIWDIRYVRWGHNKHFMCILGDYDVSHECEGQDGDFCRKGYFYSTFKTDKAKTSHW